MSLDLIGKYNTAKVFTDNIQETVMIVDILKPVYNFKAH